MLTPDEPANVYVCETSTPNKCCGFQVSSPDELANARGPCGRVYFGERVLDAIEA